MRQAISEGPSALAVASLSKAWLRAATGSEGLPAQYPSTRNMHCGYHRAVKGVSACTSVSFSGSGMLNNVEHRCLGLPVAGVAVAPDSASTTDCQASMIARAFAARWIRACCCRFISTDVTSGPLSAIAWFTSDLLRSLAAKLAATLCRVLLEASFEIACILFETRCSGDGGASVRRLAPSSLMALTASCTIDDLLRLPLP